VELVDALRKQKAHTYKQLVETQTLLEMKG
jgi:hypothetical protein